MGGGRRRRGIGPGSGSNRVNRGGGWNNNARNCRSANRNRNDPGNRDNNLGVRLVSTVKDSEGPIRSDPRPASAGTNMARPVRAGSAVREARGANVRAGLFSGNQGSGSQGSGRMFPGLRHLTRCCCAFRRLEARRALSFRLATKVIWSRASSPVEKRRSERLALFAYRRGRRGPVRPRPRRPRPRCDISRTRTRTMRQVSYSFQLARSSRGRGPTEPRTLNPPLA